MTELLPPQEIDQIRTQFQELGHVGVSRCFDPRLATSARLQLDSLIKRQIPDHITNSLKDTVTGFNVVRQPDLGVVIKSLHEQVKGFAFEPWPENASYLMQQLEMEPGKKGTPHTDNPQLVGAVGITNLKGSSRLIVEGGVDYSIENGDAVFLDPAAQLLHYGIAGDEGKRIGLVVSVRK